MFGMLSAGLGLGMGLYNTITGAKQAREAEEALNNYQRQELQNIADGLSVSTLGADLLREENARISASNIEGLRGSGTRGIIGGSGRVGADTNRMNREIASDLDRQQGQIDQIAAQDRAAIRTMQENREIGDINALSSQITAGNQLKQTGFGNIIQSTGMLGGIAGTIGGAGMGAVGALNNGGAEANQLPSYGDPSQNAFRGTQSGGSGIGATSGNIYDFDLGNPAMSPSNNPIMGSVPRNPRMGGIQYDFYGNPISN